MEILIEEQTREFIKRLPEISLNPPSGHLLMLAIRSRKAKEQLGEKMKDLVVERKVIRPIPDWRDRYFNSVYNMALLQHQGKFEFKDIALTPAVFGIFGTIGPRSFIRAIGELTKENWEYVARTNDDGAKMELTKQNSRFFGAMSRNKIHGETPYPIIDIDTDDPEVYRGIRDMVSTLPKLMITKCSRGPHIILKLSSTSDREAFYGRESIASKIGIKYPKPVCDILKEGQQPVAGTRYAAKNNPDNFVEILD